MVKTRWGELNIEEDPARPGHARIKRPEWQPDECKRPGVAMAGTLGHRSKWEAAYERHLEVLKRAGVIAGFRYEGLKVRLARRTWFTPDFLVILPDGTVEIHEVKGFRRDDAMVKLKVAAELYACWRWFLVTRESSGWKVEPMGAA